jgi:hypothetical protein
LGVHSLSLLTAFPRVWHFGQLARVIAHVSLAPGNLISLSDRVGDISLGAAGLVLLKLAFSLLQLLQRRGSLCGGIAVPTSRGAAHGVGRLLQFPCGVLKVRTILLAGQPLQTASGFLRLIGQRSLLRSAAGGATGLAQIP